MHITRHPNNSPENTSKFWVDLLNSTQLISKNISYFPQVKACHLRVAYKKLQSTQHPSRGVPQNPLVVTNLQKTKGSFLLDKQLSTLEVNNSSSNKNHIQSLQARELSHSIENTPNKYEKLDRKRRTLLNNSTTRYGNSHFIFDNSVQLIRTVDVSQIKKLTSLKNTEHSLQPPSKTNSTKKNKQFTQYFKKVILSQKTNNQLHRLFSEGKGLDISDRNNFQKLERVKLSIENRKLQEKEKSFRCVSTKLNKYDIGKKDVELPYLKNMRRREEMRNREAGKQGSVEKGEQNGKKKVISFACQPWEIDSHYNHDIQQH